METSRWNLLTRSDSIVVTDYNTIKFTDFSIQSFLNSLSDKDEKDVEYNDFLRKLLIRSDYALAEQNGLNEDIYDAMVSQYYLAFQMAAPETLIMDMLRIAKHQKFVSSISLLSKEYTLYDRDIFNEFAQYKTNEELSQKLKSMDWTVLITDRVQTVYDMVKNYNLDISSKSVIFSKLGYNFQINSSGRMMTKYQKELGELCPDTDFTMYSLFNFIKLEDDEQ